MIKKNKYNIGDRVKVKINYKNDTREEIEAIILGAEFVYEINSIRYKIEFEPTKSEKKQGCTKCSGYVLESDIVSGENENNSDWMTQPLTPEEKQEIIMRARLKEQERKVTERIIKDVTERITKEVTERITKQGIQDVYVLLRREGVPDETAIIMIAAKKDMSEDEVRRIINSK